MSYCVNCGVQLDNAEGKCPLCDTVVNNPNEPFNPHAEKPYPPRTSEQNLTISKKYYALLIALVLLVPAGICFLVDFLPDFFISWSAYPIGALIMLSIFAAVPVFFKRHRIYLMILTDSAALCAFLWLIEQLTQGNGWFSKVTFPILVLATVMIFAMVASVRQGMLKGLMIAAVSMILTAILAVCIELTIASIYLHTLHIVWSFYVLIPCFLIAGVLIVLHLNAPLRSELHRRLHL